MEADPAGAVRETKKRGLAMNCLNVVAPRACALPIALMASALALAISAAALAQTLPAPPAPAPKAPPAQPKAQPKAPPAQSGPAAAVNGPGAQDVQLEYTPWTKLCGKGQEADAKQVCATGREGRTDVGFLVVSAVLIEPEGAPSKILRITLPLGMALQAGTRVIVDQGQPINAPFVACFPNGCMAEIEASGELIGKMKKGQGLVVQGYHMQRGPVAVPIPLAEFAKANDGQATDQKTYEDRMKKLEDGWQKKIQQLQSQSQGH
jgi:invasion protein IalB